MGRTQEAAGSADVRIGPQRYIRADGAVRNLADALADYDAVAFITGQRSFDAFVRAGGQADERRVFRYDGTVTERNIDELAGRITGADLVVGIGGGRVLDTAKAVADQCRVDCVAVPTIAATCAAYSSVSVLYDEHHRRIAGRALRHPARTVLVDSRIIASSPVQYLRSGIGDTLAKWYEAWSISRLLAAPTPAERLGLEAARITRDALKEQGRRALQDNANGTSSEALGQVIDTIIAISGAVAGFAGRNGRSSGAHAIHNALTAIPGNEQRLHGAKVAYGVLVLLAYLDEWDEIDGLLPLYQALHLPMHLADNGVQATEACMAKVCDIAAGPHENFILADPNVTAGAIYAALQRLEGFLDGKGL